MTVHTSNTLNEQACLVQYCLLEEFTPSNWHLSHKSDQQALKCGCALVWHAKEPCRTRPYFTMRVAPASMMAAGQVSWPPVQVLYDLWLWVQN